MSISGGGSGTRRLDSSPFFRFFSRIRTYPASGSRSLTRRRISSDRRAPVNAANATMG
jgi:hypothetical protein